MAGLIAAHGGKAGRPPGSGGGGNNSGSGGGGHHNNKHKHRKRPCGNPPAIPTSVVFTVQATEAHTHLRFTGKLKWAEVTADEQGHTTQMRQYDCEFRATDVAGVPVETEDSSARIRAHVKADGTHFGIKDATAAASVATYTLSRNHLFTVGDSVTVVGVKPTAYNGASLIVLAGGLTNTTFKANIGSTPAQLTDGGTVMDNASSFHVTTHNLARPKTWYWQGRVRAVDHNGCQGDWSAWTTPLLPWTGADPTPPVPQGVTLTYDRVGKHRHDLFRGIVSWTKVQNFNYNGGAGNGAGGIADNEDDVRGYDIKMEVSDDAGATWSPYAHHLHRGQPDGSSGGDLTPHVTFHRIHRKQYYRAAVRSVDKFNRQSAWSSTVQSQGGDNTPPSALTNLVAITNIRRVGMRWQVPLEAPLNVLPDPTVAHVHFQIDKSTTFASLVDEGYKAPGHGSTRYAVPSADDGVTHYMRIRPIDTEGNVGAWQPVNGSGAGNNYMTLIPGLADGVPIGSIHKFHPQNMPTSGVLWKSAYFWCDGATVSRTTYSALFAEIGTTAGVGDGSTTFNLPNHRGKSAIGNTTSSHASAVVGARDSVETTGLGPLSPIDHQHDAHGTHGGHARHGNHPVHGNHNHGRHTGGGGHTHGGGSLKTGGPSSVVQRSGSTGNNVPDPAHTHQIDSTGLSGSGGGHGGGGDAVHDSAVVSDTSNPSPGHPLHAHLEHLVGSTVALGDHDSNVNEGHLPHQDHFPSAAGQHRAHHHPWIAVVFAIRAL